MSSPHPSPKKVEKQAGTKIAMATNLTHNFKETAQSILGSDGMTKSDCSFAL